MEITAGSAVCQGAVSLKADFRQQTGKGDIVVLAVDTAQLRTSVPVGEIPINAPV